MKILKLRLKNIHSLRGEHLIDFTSPPLLDAGLFAITGPTGAGKSTILDVITLSLFNKIPRFAVKGTESISRNDIEKIGSVMTHFTDDAYAEIEYECHNKAYRSRWSISRARTGNLRDYDMELATLSDNKLFDLKKSEVPEENERILGLKYEQFIRSILLSQGDFARFLKSDDKDRAKLLEDITDSHIYREIGKRTFESAKIKEEELKSLRMQSNMITFADEQALSKLENNLLEYQKVLKTLTDEITNLSSSLQQINTKNQLINKKNELQNLKINLDKKKAEFAHKAVKLSKHQELDAFRHSLTLWQIENDRLEKLSESIKLQKLQAQKSGDSLATALNKMSEFVHATVTESNFMSQMKLFENKIIDLDGQLKTLEHNGKSLKERLHSLFQKNDEAYTFAIKEGTSVEQQLKVASLRMVELKAIKTVFKGSRVELAETLQKVQEEILYLTSFYKDIKQAEDNTAINEALLVEISGFESEIKVFEAEQTLINEELLKLKSEIQNQNNQKEHWLKIASLDEHRSELKEDQPCPLCGSIHHPYAENIPLNIGQNEINLHQLNNQLKEKENIEGQLKTNIAIKMSGIQSHRQRISENNEKILVILKAHPDIKMSAEKIAADIEHKKQLESDYKKDLVLRAEKEFLEETAAILNELQKVASQFREIKGQRMDLYAGIDINGDANKIQNLFSAAKQSVQSLQVAIETNEKEYTASTAKWAQLNNTLNGQLLLLGYSNVETAILSILEDEELRFILSEKDIIQAEETALYATSLQIENDLKLFLDVPNDEHLFNQMTMELNNLNTKKDQKHQETGAIENELKNQNELRKKFLDLKNIISQKEKEATPILYLNTLIGDATGNKYAKFAQNISIKHLISLANARLVKLTDRYQLADSDIEEDMKILDLYQGNTTRSVKTLSGGETFIVSLALALSLADMASKNVRLDSLFIDEGFGTLDMETMEMALITLEKLQSEGNRTIGIISHVESLKERITTQIKVKKDNFGYSKILIE